MPTNATCPKDYDAKFIAQQADTVFNFGSAAHPSDPALTLLVFPIEKFDAVQEAIAAYPVAYKAVAGPVKILAIADKRRAAIESFKFNGITIALDPETRANLTGAALGLMRCPDVLEIDWSVTPGNFVALPRDVVLAMADAAFRYVQQCFTRARELTEAVNNAPDIFELAAIDIDEGWPE